MALQFRNLTVTPDDPVEEWGVEGILTAIERGGIQHIQRIMRSVRRDPHGEVARWVHEAAACTDHPVAARLDILTTEFQGGEPARVARRIRDAIDRTGRSLQDIAAELGTSASRLSTYATGKVMPSAAMLLRIEALQLRQD
ncbi:MAG: helix-turn-helix domain-containing protein [Propionibacteriaceae bacterium]|nr:helix-turn-helix domain-containing protein [Propionibacteriaceae bacterium]